MKILGQDSNGRIVIDGEGIEVHVRKDGTIPADSPCFITNFNFIFDSENEPNDELIKSEEADK